MAPSLRRLIVVTALLGSPAAASAQELMPTTASGWAPFAPRAVTAPARTASQGSSGYSLSINGNGVQNVYGGWTTRIAGLQGGAYYRFRARAAPLQIVALRESITIVL